MKLIFLENGEKFTASKLRHAIQQAESEGLAPNEDGYYSGWISDEGKQSLLSEFESLAGNIRYGSIFEEEPKSPMKRSGVTFVNRNLVAAIE